MTFRIRIKICGLTRQQDVEAAVMAGVDALGLVFYPPSSRYVSLDQAQDLRSRLPPFVDAVALFVNASHDEVAQVLDTVQPDLLQFHGDESPEFCASFAHRYLRAFRIGGPELDTPQKILAQCLKYPDATAWLFDSYSSSYGGSGLSFDTSLLHEVLEHPHSRPLILAGGLNVDSVRPAIRQIQPFAVDVSSGVEVSPGIKSAQKITAFVQAVSAG